MKADALTTKRKKTATDGDVHSTAERESLPYQIVEGILDAIPILGGRIVKDRNRGRMIVFPLIVTRDSEAVREPFDALVEYVRRKIAAHAAPSNVGHAPPDAAPRSPQGAQLSNSSADVLAKIDGA